MVQKIKVSILFLTVLFGMGANGFGWFDYSSSSETDSAYHLDNDLELYDDDSDDRISFDDFKRLFNVQTSPDDEKWNEIDNLELIDYTQDDQFVEMVQHSEVHGVMMYTLGKRVRGDKLVASSAKNQTWAQYQDIKSNMTYPANGVVGRNLTYVEIQVNQTSNLGQAYVVRGGVNQRFITIIVEAYRTMYFNFKTSFYGL
ncbi:uncharacterized protein LOC119067559 [Bradysia coprophila]|uniref:uncharacterized protein LOC119067559 n=1 Tax=Bradysia coprophila TaxID=38358 RepID=UPI00187D7188|nr:uncharacterized protein LOC119067559 [Bradysia coprophila]